MVKKIFVFLFILCIKVELFAFCVTNVPNYISGITCISNNTYALVADRGGKVYTVTLPDVDDETLLLNVEKEYCTEGKDYEAVGFDGNYLWIADEADSNVYQYAFVGDDLKRVSKIEMPEYFKKNRPNRGIEAFTISHNGLEAWCCTEMSTLSDDEDLSEDLRGRVVRLTRFKRESVDSTWKYANQFRYVIDPIEGTNFKGLALSGVSDMCYYGGDKILVLEREFSRKGFMPLFRTTIYSIDLTKLRELAIVKEDTSIDKLSLAEKKLEYRENSRLINNEGIYVLDEEKGIVILVSDGDQTPAVMNTINLR